LVAWCETPKLTIEVDAREVCEVILPGIDALLDQYTGSAIPRIEAVKNGWAAYGNGWAVRGETPEDARARYLEAERRHREIESRSDCYKLERVQG